jgi:hypothetical protein
VTEEIALKLSRPAKMFSRGVSRPETWGITLEFLALLSEKNLAPRKDQY